MMTTAIDLSDAPSVTLMARLVRLAPGACILEMEKSTWSRGALEKAVREAAKYEGATYKVDLCYGIQHDGQGQNFRLFRITRSA